MPISEICKEGRHARHVQLHVPVESRLRLMENPPRGFTLKLYAPPKLPNQFVDEETVTLTIVVNENEPEPQYRRFKEDIDDYLTGIGSIDSRIKILSDKVSKKDQPDLVEDWFIKNEVILDHPGLDDMDDLRSRAGNIRDVEVPESQVMNMEAEYERLKKDYVRTKLQNVEDTGKVDPQTGQKIKRVKYGDI